MTTHGDEAAAINRAIGSRVSWYLRYAGDRHTQTELGDLLGLDQSAVSKKLRGERPFYLPELYAISKWLDRPISDFVPTVEELDAAPPLPMPTPPRARRRVAIPSGVSSGSNGQLMSSTRVLTREYLLCDNCAAA